MKTTAWAILALVGLSASAAAQDGGKLSWRGKTDDIKTAMADAKRDNRPMILFFTSAG